MIVTKDFTTTLSKAHTNNLKITFDDSSKEPVSHTLKSGQVWSTDLAELSSAFLHTNSVIVDIGTHIGTFSVLAASITKKKVISIEPDPLNFSLLSQNSKNNGFDYHECYNVAASDKKGTIMFCQNGPSGHVLEEGGSEPAVEIPCVPADDIIGDRVVDFIKIDVEGWELNVLDGLKSTISKFRPVIAFEVNGFTLKWFNKTPNDLLRYLEEKYNYQIFAIGRTLIPISSFEPFPFGVIDCFALQKNHIPFIQRLISLPLSFHDRESILGESVYRANQDMKGYFDWYQTKSPK